MPAFEPNYQYMLDVLNNKRPERLPLYEHIISPLIMEKILGKEFAYLEYGNSSDLDEFFKHYTRFFKQMTYDTVSYEVCITEVLPGHGAIRGGRGPIQSPQDFAAYPWSEIPHLYWEYAGPKFEALARHMPSGMLALGGVGNGVLEISEDLVGFEALAYTKADYPELFTSLYQKIGSLMFEIWEEFLRRYADCYAICRFGDDLGFKSGTLVSPQVLRKFIIPRYKPIIDLIHQAGKPFLWHSCGKIFSIMDDVIALGINAKHSNEDIIAPYDEWIARYSDRIGLLGGIDVDLLCQKSPAEITQEVYTRAKRFRTNARGYALGSGNSIPEYVPVDGYLAMLDAAIKIREEEAV